MLAIFIPHADSLSPGAYLMAFAALRRERPLRVNVSQRKRSFPCGGLVSHYYRTDKQKAGKEGRSVAIREKKFFSSLLFAKISRLGVLLLPLSLMEFSFHNRFSPFPFPLCLKCPFLR